MALDTTYKKPGKTTASGREAFDPASYGDKTFPKAVGTLEKSAVPLPELHAALRKDQDAAGEQYGKRQGTSPYSFATTGEGVAGKAEGGLMPVQVKGVPKTHARLAAGRAGDQRDRDPRRASASSSSASSRTRSSTRPRPRRSTTRSRHEVLKGIDPQSLAGKRVSFLGAFTLVTPNVVTITPVTPGGGA